MKTFYIFPIIALLFYSCAERSSSEIRFVNESTIDTIPFDYFKTGHIRVPVEIDTNTYNLILDTGAGNSLFHKNIEIKGEHTLFNTNESNTQTINNINGDSFFVPFGTIIEKLKIGNVDIHKGGYYRAGYDQERTPGAGILGNNILGNMVFKIDFLRSELQLSKTIENFDLQGYEEYPISIVKNSPHLNIEVGGKSFLLIIDTGNPGNFLSLNNKERNHFKEKTGSILNWQMLKQANFLDTIWSPEQEKRISLGFLKTNIILGKYQFNDQYIKFNAQPASQVGLDFLQAFGKVIFDYRNKKLYLAKPKERMSMNQLFDIAKYVNSNGVLFSQDTIHKVIGLSPIAEQQGIKLQDTLISLDGRDITKKIHNYPGSDFTATTEVLLDNFYYVMGNKTANVELKSTHGIKKYTLERQYLRRQLPDSVQSFGLIDQFIYLAPTALQKGNYTAYKVRKLPKDVRK